MSTLGDRIRFLREDRGWSMDELARRALISTDALWKIETDKVKKPYTLRRIADALGVPISELRANGHIPPNTEEQTDITPSPSIVILGEVQAGGFVEPIVYHSDEDPKRLPMSFPAAVGAIALKIVGDSMEPTYRAGDYIICVPIDQSQMEKGDDVVIQCGGQDGRATFKRVHGAKGDTLLLKPINGKHKLVECDRGDVVRVLRVQGALLRGLACRVLSVSV